MLEKLAHPARHQLLCVNGVGVDVNASIVSSLALLLFVIFQDHIVLRFLCPRARSTRGRMTHFQCLPFLRDCNP